jgi:hypothetical protein
MADTKQQKINAKLHEEVREFVDSDESNYSGYKDFYEQAAREKLEDERGSDLDLTIQADSTFRNLPGIGTVLQSSFIGMLSV